MRCDEGVTWVSMLALLRMAVVSARMVRLTPHAKARGQEGVRKLVAARWAPTKEEEQAVSIEMDGPFSANVYDSRPQMTDSDPEVAVYADMGMCVVFR
jgi:hypothetical protein